MRPKHPYELEERLIAGVKRQKEYRDKMKTVNERRNIYNASFSDISTPSASLNGSTTPSDLTTPLR